MLYLDYNVDESKVITDPGGEFDVLYAADWFEDSNIVAIAEGIDKLKHISNDRFFSELFGTVTGRQLSGGTKTVILCYLRLLTEYIYPLLWLGENCFEYMSLVPDVYDITFKANTMPNLDEWGCTFISKKTGKVITGFETYWKEYCLYVN